MGTYLRGSKKLQRGEIATIVAIGTLVVIGITSLASSLFLQKKQSTSSKASTACEKGQTSDQGCAAYGCPKGTKRICTCGGPDWSNSTCECKADSSCPGGDTGSGGGGGTVTCNEGYYCEGSDCFKKLKSCGRDGPVDKSFCAGQSCGPSSDSGKGAGGSESPTATPTQPQGAGAGGQCAWGDWDCAAQGANGDAGRMCAKMGKGFCDPGKGKCVADGSGNACVPNKWDDSWGCWGPTIQKCAPSPAPTTSKASGTDCTPGQGGWNGSKYYCCYKAGEGDSKLSYPHYEDEGEKAVDCAVKTGVGQPTTKEPSSAPSTCGSKSVYYGERCQNQCGTEPGEANWTCEKGWCCEPKSVSPAPQSTSGCIKVDCPNGYTGSYYSRSKDGKLEGFFETENACKIQTSSSSQEETVKASVCKLSTSVRDCADDDYTLLADNGACGGEDRSCQQNQKKYTKAKTNKCNGSDTKCKYDSTCGQSLQCVPVQCESGRTGVYQKGESYYFNSSCNGLPAASSKKNACGPNIADLSCAFATRAGCWFTDCVPISRSTSVSYSCKQDLAGWGYCCPPGKSPPNSGQSFTTAGQGFTFSAGSQTAIDFGDLSCYQSTSDTYVCKPK